MPTGRQRQAAAERLANAGRRSSAAEAIGVVFAFLLLGGCAGGLAARLLMMASPPSPTTRPVPPATPPIARGWDFAFQRPRHYYERLRSEKDVHRLLNLLGPPSRTVHGMGSSNPKYDRRHMRLDYYYGRVLDEPDTAIVIVFIHGRFERMTFETRP